VRRAEDAGCAAVLLTADVPWIGRRLRDVRNGFALPPEVTPANLTGAAAATARHAADRNRSAVAAHTGATFASTLD
jgi:4-hydroxymandelate oxidase